MNDANGNNSAKNTGVINHYDFTDEIILRRFDQLELQADAIKAEVVLIRHLLIFQNNDRTVRNIDAESAG